MKKKKKQKLKKFFIILSLKYKTDFSYSKKVINFFLFNLIFSWNLSIYSYICILDLYLEIPYQIYIRELKSRVLAISFLFLLLSAIYLILRRLKQYSISIYEKQYRYMLFMRENFIQIAFILKDMSKKKKKKAKEKEKLNSFFFFFFIIERM